jgi:hypothetical protein
MGVQCGDCCGWGMTRVCPRFELLSRGRPYARGSLRCRPPTRRRAHRGACSRRTARRRTLSDRRSHLHCRPREGGATVRTSVTRTSSRKSSCQRTDSTSWSRCFRSWCAFVSPQCAAAAAHDRRWDSGSRAPLCGVPAPFAAAAARPGRSVDKPVQRCRLLDACTHRTPAWVPC